MNTPRLTRWLVWLCLAAAMPATAGYLTTARAIAWPDQNDTWQVYAFVRGNDAHLHGKLFNGSTWSWVDHGLPPGATTIYDPQPITYVDSSGTRRHWIFAVDSNNRLVARHQNGMGLWTWRIQDGPALRKTSGNLSVITFIDTDGLRKIYVFGVGKDDRHLWVNYWNGSIWQWADNGILDDYFNEGGKSCVGTHALTFEDLGQRQIRVYCEGHLLNSDSASLIANSYPHSPVSPHWEWFNLGGGYGSLRAVDVVAYLDDLAYIRQIAFYTGESHGMPTLWMTTTIPQESHLGSPYQFPITFLHDLGMPPRTDPITKLSSTSAITWLQGGTRAIYAFTAAEGRLYVNYGGIASRVWADQGAPANMSVQDPEALTFLDSDGKQKIYVFTLATGRTENVQANYWNGTSWSWINLGAP